MGIDRKCDGNCPLCEVVNKAVEMGVLVVAAAGNDGPAIGTINCPANARKAIAVGAVDKSDNVWNKSSRGKKNQKKPDLVAPGVVDVSGFTMSGTSLSAPLVTGALALLLSKYKDKEKVLTSLLESCEDLDYEFYEQGHGKLRVDKALRWSKR